MEISPSLQVTLDQPSPPQGLSARRSKWRRLASCLGVQVMAIALPVVLLASTAQAGVIYLQRNDYGSPVGRLQRALNQRGEFIRVDDDFGSETERAVKSFQRRNGLRFADGYVDEDTLRALGLTPRDVERGGRSSGLVCGTFEASNPSQEAFTGRYRVIVPTNDAQALADVRRRCPRAYAVATPLGSYISAGSFPDLKSAENRQRYLRDQGFRDAHVRYF